ncbi:MAG: hypothetical protein ACP5T4_01960 [Candidatus Micrarchaeia archaeon]
MGRVSKSIIGKIVPRVPFLILTMPLAKQAGAAEFALDIISTLNGIQALLAHIGPLLSGIMFIISGIFFAIAQLFPAYKRASMHSTASDILVGAIIVAVLSVASNGLALASAKLLVNTTNAT